MSLSAYLVFLCPGIFWRDAGELSAAAYGLGVAHPTGFVTWTLLGKLASFLPLGHIAVRINVLSALCGAGVVALSYPLMLSVMGEDGPAARAAAAAASLAMAFGSTLWLHSTTAEVYAPNLLAIVVLIRLVGVDWASDRALRMGAVVTGLAAGLHAVTALVAAAIWGVCFLRRWARPERRIARDLAWTAGLALAAMAVLAYLPLRASTDPWRNWGDPDTWDGFVAHLTGARIRAAFGGKMGGQGAWDINSEYAMIQLLEQVSWAGLLAVPGALWLALRRTQLAGLMLIIWSADFIFSFAINPMGMPDRQTGLIATLVTFVFISAGGFFLVGRVVGRYFSVPMTRLLTFVAVFGLALPATVSGGRIRDVRRLYHPQMVGDMAMDRASPAGLLLVSSDDMASATTYLQGVENRRPDCTTVVRQHVTDLSYLAGLRRWHGAEHLTDPVMHAAEAGGSPLAVLQLLIDENKGRRPVYWEIGESRTDRLVAADLRVDLPLARLFGSPLGDVQGLYVRYRILWRRVAGGQFWPGTALSTLARTFSQLGAFYASRGDPEYARQSISEAFMTDRDEVQVLSNYAALLISEGRPEQAVPRYLDVVARRPAYARGWYNLGVARFQTGDGFGGIEAFGIAARLGLDGPSLARAAYYASILEANHGSMARALVLMDSAAGQLPAAEKKDATAKLQLMTQELLKAHFGPRQ